MPETTQARTERRAPETEVSVDLTESDPNKAVTRRAKPPDIAEGVRDDAEHGRWKKDAERALFKRMSRFQKNITKEFDQRLAEQEARHNQEIAALRERGGGVSVEGRDVAELSSAHEKAMKVLEEQLAAANEKGDSAGAARITAEMIKADGAYHAKLSGAKQREDTSGQPTDQRRPQQQSPAKAGNGPTQAGARFILANNEWWDDPDYVAEKAAASGIFIELRDNEGFDANSDETYREVAKRLREKFPHSKDLFKGARKGRPAEGDDLDDPDPDLDGERDEDAPHRRRAPAAALQDRGSTANQRRSGTDRRALSAQDIATMRACNLNPDNDRDVVQFLREAIALDAAGA